MKNKCMILSVAVIVLVSNITDAKPEKADKKFPWPNLTLKQSIKLAVKNNSTLNQYKQKIEVSKSLLIESFALITPTAYAKMEYEHFDHETKMNNSQLIGEDLSEALNVGGDVLMTKANSAEISGRADLPLINVASWLTIRAAKSNVYLSETSFAVAKQQFKHYVTNAYITALIHETLLDIAEKQLTLTTQHYHTALNQYDAGTKTELDILQTKSQMVKAQNYVYDAETALFKAKSAIMELTGRKNDFTLQPVSITIPRILKKGTKETLQNNGDLLIAKQSIVVNKKQLNIHRAAFLPTIGASWQGTYRLSKPTQFEDKDKSRWSGMVTLTVPLFDFSLFANLKRQKAIVAEATLDYKIQFNKTIHEINRIEKEYEILSKQIMLNEKDVRIAKQMLSIVESAFNHGSINTTEVREATHHIKETVSILEANKTKLQLLVISLYNLYGIDIEEMIR